MHSMPALLQFEQGSLLLQRTFRRRQVTQLRGLSWLWGAAVVVVVLVVVVAIELEVDDINDGAVWVWVWCC